MKSFAFIITATLLTASTCTRQQIEAGFAQTMIGRWEFKSSMGGYAGKRIEAETGKKLVLEFKPNQEFQKTF